jgi:hypothetical protein
VIVLQSNQADTGRERIAAPIAPRAAVTGTNERLVLTIDI